MLLHASRKERKSKNRNQLLRLLLILIFFIERSHAMHRTIPQTQTNESNEYNRIPLAQARSLLHLVHFNRLTNLDILFPVTVLRYFHWHVHQESCLDPSTLRMRFMDRLWCGISGPSGDRQSPGSRPLHRMLRLRDILSVWRDGMWYFRDRHFGWNIHFSCRA